MNQHCKVLEDFVDLTDLLLDLLDSLLSFLNNGLIEGNFIIQKQDLLPARSTIKKLNKKTQGPYSLTKAGQVQVKELQKPADLYSSYGTKLKQSFNLM